MACHQIDLLPEVGEVARLAEWVEQRGETDGLSADLVFKLTLVLEEAVMNAIAHGFVGMPPPHAISVRLDIGDATVLAEIADNGRPFDPTIAPPPDLSSRVEERDPGGLGIHLMRTMMDRVEYRRDGGRNRLRLEKCR